MRPLIATRRPFPQHSAPRRDPAPSRTAYRMQRLWLTPFVRAALRIGLPAFVLTFGVGLYLADPDRREALGAIYTDMRETVKNRPEFLVN